MTVILEATHIVKSYRQGDCDVEVLKDISFSVNKSELITIGGKSGSGKSTLLHILGGLEKPSKGHVILDGKQLESYNDNELAKFRRQNIGFVFQFFNLLPTLNVMENVALPLLLDGHSLASLTNKCMQLLEQVNLADRATHFPNQLSGGEMQRVAIARALVSDPKIVFADEPTGNLDSENSKIVCQLLTKAIRTRKQTLLLISHDPMVLNYGDRTIVLQDGLITSAHTPLSKINL